MTSNLGPKMQFNFLAIFDLQASIDGCLIGWGGEAPRSLARTTAASWQRPRHNFACLPTTPRPGRDPHRLAVRLSICLSYCRLTN